MKRLLLLLPLLLAGCDDTEKPPSLVVQSFPDGDFPWSYEVLSIGGCEYVRRSDYHDIVHHGGCPSCWQRLSDVIHARAEKP